MRRNQVRKRVLKVKLGIAALALASVIGCGGGGGSSGTWGVNTSTCPAEAGNPYLPMPSEACTSCLSSNCSAQANTCYGSFFQMGSPGGTCGPFFTCICACKSASDSACIANCSSMLTDACNTCQDVYGSCMKTNCSSQCMTSSSVPDMATDL
jgi:hypothetical protein